MMRKTTLTDMIEYFEHLGLFDDDDDDPRRTLPPGFAWIDDYAPERWALMDAHEGCYEEADDVGT